MTEPPFNMDAYAPAEMATRIETVGVAKANLDAATMFALSVLGGAFIALGANLTTVLFTDHGLGYGVSRVAGGLVSSLGLMLVLVGGAELFTGNSLIVMAWACGRVSTGRLLRNWLIVYAGNFTGAPATAVGRHNNRRRQSQLRLSPGLCPRRLRQCLGVPRRLVVCQHADDHRQDPRDHPP
jgi:formate/nitrite transporter FocA (FNT family)